jgi:hypothetical protein
MCIDAVTRDNSATRKIAGTGIGDEKTRHARPCETTLWGRTRIQSHIRTQPLGALLQQSLINSGSEQILREELKVLWR